MKNYLGQKQIEITNGLKRATPKITYTIYTWRMNSISGAIKMITYAY